MKRLPIALLFLLLLTLLPSARPALASSHDKTGGRIIPIPECPSCDGNVVCLLENLPCYIAQWALQPVDEALYRGFKGFGDTLSPIVKPILFFSLAVPVIGGDGYLGPAGLEVPNIKYYGVVTETLYSVIRDAGYALMSVLFIASLAVLMASTIEDRWGEALAYIKRIMLVSILLAVLKEVYNGAAVLAVALESHILGFTLRSGSMIDYVNSLISVVGGSAASIAVGLLLVGGWSFVIALLMVLAFLLVLASLKFMLMTLLAVMLPLAVVLAVAPLQPLRQAGQTMISMLVNLLIASIATAVVFALGGLVVSVTRGEDLYANAVRLIVSLASFMAPAISLYLAPRAGLALQLTSMFLAYTAKPAIEQVARQVWPQVAAAGEALQQAPYIGRIVRPAARLYHITRSYPLGAYGYPVARLYKAYMARQTEKLWQQIQPPTIPWEWLEGRKPSRPVKG